MCSTRVLLWPREGLALFERAGVGFRKWRQRCGDRDLLLCGHRKIDARNGNAFRGVEESSRWGSRLAIVSPMDPVKHADTGRADMSRCPEAYGASADNKNLT